MQRFFLVQAVLKTAYGEYKARPRIVVGSDPISASRVCFDELGSNAKVPGKKFPDRFLVWSQRSFESFNENVGSIVVDEDTGDSVEDMFESTPVEVRL